VSIRQRLFGISATLWLAFSTCSAVGAADAVLDLATFAQSTVDVGKPPHAQHFDVWIADTPARQAQGLMFVRDLPVGRGMLFLEKEAHPMAFWMKNTYIELDMLFIGPDRRIVKIAARAPPLSLDNINSDAPVIAVLEIKGGEAQRRGIHSGDLVSWPQSSP
jgi:uncharacterized membrane protein (UPF0127 family)